MSRRTLLELANFKITFRRESVVKTKEQRSCFTYTYIFSFRFSLLNVLVLSRFLLFFEKSERTLLSSNGVIIFLLNHYSFSIIVSFSSVKNYSSKSSFTFRSSFSPTKNLSLSKNFSFFLSRFFFNVLTFRKFRAIFVNSETR